MTGRRTGKTAMQEGALVIGFDGSVKGSGVVIGQMVGGHITIVGGSPCLTAPSGRLVAWYENWIRA